MNVAYASNEKYFDMLMTSIYSLLSHNNDVSLYIYLNSKKQNYFKKLEQLAENFGSKLHFFSSKEIQALIASMDFKIESYLSLETYFRLFLDKLVQLDRILYLDVDTLVLDNLEELYLSNLDQDYLIAARPYDKSLPWVKGIMRKYDLRRGYFNSGVLLLNLRRLKNTNNLHDAIVIASEKKINDQYALNIVFDMKFLEISPRYNWTRNIFNFYGKKSIVHFTGEFKPNIYFFRHPDAKIYRSYYRQVNSFYKFSFRYYIYTLKRILIKIKLVNCIFLFLLFN